VTGSANHGLRDGGACYLKPPACGFIACSL
jgi:hypothetical protein